jgi:hypothetical protein
MLHSRRLLTGFVASSFVVSGLATLAVAADQEATPAKTISQLEPQPGRVVIVEDVWMRFNDEPSHHMQQAHDSFLKKEFKAAANELHKTAGYLHVATQHAASETKAALAASAQELDGLAKDVEAGTVKSAKTLESAFARAEQALAAHHQAKAHTALDEKRNTLAGHYLHSAVTHFENAGKWIGQELETGTAATANGVRTVAGKLIEGSGAVVDEAGKGIKWLGTEVEKLGKFMEPKKTTASSKIPTVENK